MKWGGFEPIDTPADAAPAKAGDREAADKWAAVVIQQTRLHSSLQDEDAINLAHAYIAEREASAALRLKYTDTLERHSQEVTRLTNGNITQANRALKAEQRAEAVERREGALREALADIDKAYTAYSQRNGDAQILMAELVQAIIRGGNQLPLTK